MEALPKQRGFHFIVGKVTWCNGTGACKVIILSLNGFLDPFT